MEQQLYRITWRPLVSITELVSKFKTAHWCSCYQIISPWLLRFTRVDRKTKWLHFGCRLCFHFPCNFELPPISVIGCFLPKCIPGVVLNFSPDIFTYSRKCLWHFIKAPDSLKLKYFMLMMAEFQVQLLFVSCNTVKSESVFKTVDRTPETTNFTDYIMNLFSSLFKIIIIYIPTWSFSMWDTISM